MRIQRLHFLYIVGMFLIIGDGAIAAAPPVQRPDYCREDRSKELGELKNADQEDRKDLSNTNWPEVMKRDEVRRKRVAEIFAEGCLVTSKDYYNAALIFQHGTAPDHFLQTYIWASKSQELDIDRENKRSGLAALGVDRYLRHLGYKQLYASQAEPIVGDPNGCYCLWPVEELSTDADRAKMNRDSLAQQLRWIDSLNSKKPSCRPASQCKVEAKPVPKGFVPGVNW